ncbi:MAG: WecB/TagA/CpsF family glycosyltransferase [Chloroflexi bacterium]|nr:WecB/TagA/CpsF family glycosyltransferase [Chloroflexota bacterium]
MVEAVELVLGWVAAGAPRLVVTPNPEIVMAARRDAGVAAILQAAALAVPDGIGLVLAARMLGEPLRGAVPGVDLVEALAPHAAARGHRWFLLGGAPGVAEIAATRLRERHPGLIIAGALAGEPEASHDPQTRQAIVAAAPVDLLLVAYGAPRQERWLARNLVACGATVGIGVGGTFNFIAGISRRPPRRVQHVGLGWLFRLVTEPWRWRRQLALPHFAGLVLIETIRRRSGRVSV